MLNLAALAEENSVSSTSKIAAVTAASIGMLLTQSSSVLAEKQDASAPEKVTKIAASIDLDEDVFYSALPDEVLEKAAGLGGVGLCGVTQSTCAGGRICNSPPVQKPPYSSKSRK
jgi:hypothetical protein